MVAFGPDLGMPHTRAMGKSLFELRLKSKEGIGRVFFCIQPARQI
jgi:phage-related protein